MSDQVRLIKVFLASPSDTRQHRDTVEDVIRSWNSIRSDSEGILLQSLRWEYDAVPILTGADGQEVVNEQLLARADVIVGLFHSRLGGPTPRDVSGTVEELHGGLRQGKRVHVYFSVAPHPQDHDRDQLRALDEFKQKMASLGLYGTFKDDADLQMQVFGALEADVRRFNAETLRLPVPPERPRPPNQNADADLDVRRWRALGDEYHPLRELANSAPKEAMVAAYSILDSAARMVLPELHKQDQGDRTAYKTAGTILWALGVHAEQLERLSRLQNQRDAAAYAASADFGPRDAKRYVNAVFRMALVLERQVEEARQFWGMLRTTTALIARMSGTLGV